MVTFTAPYILPLILGMTYDARNSRPGVEIYDMKYVDDAASTVYETTKSSYKVITSVKDVADTLDVSGDLSLKIKTGMINIEGKGSYLKNNRDLQNEVEILTTMDYVSKTKFFKPDAKPEKGWSSKYSLGVLGTHYVTSVTYGAELIASARFVVLNTSDADEIKGEVNLALGSGDSGNKLVVDGKLEKLAKKLSGKANLEISYYGTVPLKNIPNTVQGLTTLIENFKDQIEETGLKEGIPKSVELTPLSAIAEPGDEDKFQFLQNVDLENQLADLEEQLDELREARTDLSVFAKTLPWNLEEQYENEVGYLVRNISSVMEVFYKVIWNMDITEGVDQLKPAFDAYDYDGEQEYKKYDKLVRRLKAKLTQLIKPEEFKGDTYIQFGNKNCTAKNSVVLYEGFTVSSSEDGSGSAASYDCMPRNMKKGYELVEGEIYSRLAGIRYTKLEKDFNPFTGKNAKKIAEKGVPCAKCYATEASTVAVMHSTDKCPLTWNLMYKGYMMSSKSHGVSTNYICVDGEPSVPYTMGKENDPVLALTTVHSKGSLPSGSYTEGALIRCAVCADY